MSTIFWPVWQRIIFCIAFCAFAIADDPNPVIATQNGKVRGQTIRVGAQQQECDVFNSIPYAQPPVNDLRFRKPEPVQSWKHVRDTHAPGDHCVSTPGSEQEEHHTRPESENCLHLTIVKPTSEFTPDDEGLTNRTFGRAVMVWLSGSNFMSSADYDNPQAACANFASRDVVFVSVQYRLGYLGFLSTGDDAAPGNFGLYDQLLALRWIHDNIGAFGGDNGRVTLMGQGGGAACAGILARYPPANDLIHRVIQQSGSADAYWAISKRSLKSELRFSSVAGCTQGNSTERVECLREKRVYDLQRASRQAFGLAGAYTRPRHSTVKHSGGGHGCFECFSFDWTPTPDGDVVKRSKPPTRLGEKVAPKPTIIGITSHEMLFLVKPQWYSKDLVWPVYEKREGNLVPCFVNTKNDFSMDTFKQEIAVATEIYIDKEGWIVGKESLHEMKDLLKEIIEAVYVQENRAKGPAKRAKALTELISDIAIGLPAISDANLLRKSRWDVWLYDFDFKPPEFAHLKIIMQVWQGAPHGWDAKLTFSYDPEKVDEVSLKMKDLICDLWTNMAKHGAPTSKKAKSKFEWLQYETLTNPTHLKLNVHPTRGDKIHDPTLTTWTLYAPQVLSSKPPNKKQKKDEL